MKRFLHICLAGQLTILAVFHWGVWQLCQFLADDARRAHQTCLRRIAGIRERYPSSLAVGDMQRTVGAPSPAKDEEYW